MSRNKNEVQESAGEISLKRSDLMVLKMNTPKGCPVTCSRVFVDLAGTNQW